jgi:hypothetical protein
VKPVLKYFILILLLAALAPYFVICFYALPFADDFCFGWTASQNISFLQKFLNQYLFWNGRYTADVLVNLHPLVTGKIINYQLSIFFSLLATPVVLYFFVEEFLRFGHPRGETHRFPSTVVSIFITLFYLNYQPNVTEGIYWFIGISNYHLGNLLFILQLTILLKTFSSNAKTKTILHLFSFLLLIVAIGFNEIGAVLIPCFCLAVVVFNCRLPKANCKLWVAYSGVALIASAFVFFSPGNFVRGQEFENRFDILYSLWFSLLQTARFTSHWIFNVPFLLMSAIVVAHADKIKNKIANGFDYRLLIAALFFVVFIGSFLPYFATGMLGQHRTINFVFFFFILLWVLFLLSVSNKFLLHQKLKPLKNERVIAGLLAVSIFLMVITGNGIKIISDLKHDNFKKYETAFYQRQQVTLQNTEIPFKSLEVIPFTFSVVDVRSDTSWWVDKCMKKYYLENKMELK